MSEQEIDAATREQFRKECVVCHFKQTGEQPDDKRALTVCFTHGDHQHPDVRRFFNESRVA